MTELNVSIDTPELNYQLAQGLPPATVRYDHAITSTTTAVPCPATKRVMLFVNGLGPYPEQEYRLDGQKLTLLDHLLEPGDHVTVLV